MRKQVAKHIAKFATAGQFPDSIPFVRVLYLLLSSLHSAFNFFWLWLVMQAIMSRRMAKTQFLIGPSNLLPESSNYSVGLEKHLNPWINIYHVRLDLAAFCKALMDSVDYDASQSKITAQADIKVHIKVMQGKKKFWGYRREISLGFG
jgi:hypothetical protein